MYNIIIVLFIILLNANYAYGGDIITANIQSGCNVSINKLYTIFEPNIHTCAAGYYLPANYDRCINCPSNAYCGGGTYVFNENTDQGIFRNYSLVTENIVSGCEPRLNALYTIFQPNVHNCAPGYYMPANTDSCVICPANGYCGGGTYTFNETTDQGITSCPNNWYSPTGMSSVAQCGRILHVGDDVVYLRNVKKTTPSLNVKVGNDIFYGNMTTNDVVMHNGATHRLRIRINDTTYSVYDDTVDIDE